MGDATLSNNYWKGYGTKALAMLVNRPKELGWEKLSVSKVYEDNNEAKHLYQRFGFKKTGLFHDEYFREFASYEKILK
ncbi:GNAT family N-acetyltransferase [Cytobacillus horneckiae]|uniref:GNAT family N-acetyltransferase n=1 Tax=Cytobacillus horneckiae TaxID=549687 RepID=UPI00398B6BD1